jgi:hypothetical protein
MKNNMKTLFCKESRMAQLNLKNGKQFKGDSITVWPEINNTYRITVYGNRWSEVHIVDKSWLL